tara:strand:- start:2301 stop:2594 length:294 start_codon:yes stop_codon:yes gene_type:complete
MKKLLLAAALLSSSAMANTDICVDMHEQAGVVMRAHQSGVPATKVWEHVEGIIQMELMFEQAYSKPRYSTKAHQEKVISEFADKWFISCLKAFGEDV